LMGEDDVDRASVESPSKEEEAEEEAEVVDELDSFKAVELIA
jgi:hypothetical protein